jgi:hypothetical protein
LHAVHGRALLLVGQLSLQALQAGDRHWDLDRRLDPRVERLEQNFDAAIAAERPEDVKLPRSCRLIGFHAGQSLLGC